MEANSLCLYHWYTNKCLCDFILYAYILVNKNIMCREGKITEIDVT